MISRESNTNSWSTPHIHGTYSPSPTTTSSIRSCASLSLWLYIIYTHTGNGSWKVKRIYKELLPSSIIITMSASCDSDRVTRQVIKNVLAKLQKEGEGALVRNGITEWVFFSFSTNLFHDNPMSSSSTFIYIFLSYGIVFRIHQALLDPFVLLVDFSCKFLTHVYIFIYFFIKMFTYL